MTHTKTYRALTGIALTIGIGVVLGSETLMLGADLTRPLHSTGGGTVLAASTVALTAADASPTTADAVEATLILGMLVTLLAFVLHSLAVLHIRKAEKEEKRWAREAKTWFQKCLDAMPLPRR